MPQKNVWNNTLWNFENKNVRALKTFNETPWFNQYFLEKDDKSTDGRPSAATRKIILPKENKNYTTLDSNSKSEKGRPAEL